ncbi:MAG TPA: hypothetical protein VMV10_11510 [Pirellulales bacterium]|nr:hypothetical protein [Pirellulales bacterium]
MPTLGFLTVVQHAQHGFFGGYLLLNADARPLEFHCTAPVKPNRAQEILYGPTLEPYLYGEQIGQTLIAKSQLAPLAVYTDLPAVLAVRPHVGMPVILVLGDSPLAPNAEAPPAAATGANYRVDDAHGRAATLPAFQLGRNRVTAATGYDDDRRFASAELEPLVQHFDLAEPFARIRGAIDEAQRNGR